MRREAMRGEVADDGGLVERLDPQAEMVDVAAFAPGGTATSQAELSIHCNQIDHRRPCAQEAQAEVIAPDFVIETVEAPR